MPSTSPKTNHLINNVENAVQESLLGLVKTNPDLQLIKEYNVVIRKDLTDFELVKDKSKRRVAILSGGGSGHEPFASGWVSEHGCDAAIAGEIFSSPSSLSVLKAIQQFPKHVGILLVFNNYTGDRLNFGIAMERARLLGYNVDMLLAADDCAFHKDRAENLENLKIDESVISKSKLGTRGLAGVYFMIRLANVMAKQGFNLKELRQRLNNYSELITTYSVSLNSCDIPGVGQSFNIGSLQMELGLGIHGELGAGGRTSLEPLHSVIERMLYQLNRAVTDKLSKRLNELPADKIELIVLVNNLGGLSQFELNIVCNELIEQLSKMNILIEPDDKSNHTKELLFDRSCKISRLFSGSFLTSFAMHAVSISLLPKIDNELIQLIDTIESTSIRSNNGLLNDQPLVKAKHVQTLQTKQSIDDLSSIDEIFTKALTAACCAILHAKDELNRLDSELGDSDCGSTMATLAQNLLKEYVRNDEGLNASFYRLCSCGASQIAGGTSGVIYSLLFTGIAEAIAKEQHEYKSKHDKDLPLDDFAVWGRILDHGVRTVMKYSLASVGDRTLLDVLQPVADYLQKIDSNKLSLEEKYKKVDELSTLVNELTEETASLIPKMGRASYAATRGKCVDPGARGVQYWFNAVLDVIKKTNQQK